MAVCIYGFIARAECGALDLLAAGGRRFGSPRRHRCPTSTSRWWIFRRPGPPWLAPDTIGLGLLFPAHET